MTLQQMAYERLSKIPEDTLKLWIELFDKLQADSLVSDQDNKEIKRMAFEEMERMRKASPFPKDFDYEKAREEAMEEKYASSLGY